MAIKNTSADAVFTYSNTGRAGNQIMPDVSSGSAFGVGFSVKLNNSTPFILWSYDASDGSYIRISHNGTNWIWTWRIGVGAVTTEVIHTIDVASWVHIFYRNNGNSHRVYWSLQTYPFPPSSVLEVNVTASITLVFDSLTLTAGQSNAICNYKFYQSAITQAQVEESRDEWLSTVSFTITAWEAFLRLPGDLYNQSIQFPDPWIETHEWDTAPARLDLSTETDPDILTIAPCIAWVLPVGGVNTSTDITKTPVTATAGEYFEGVGSFVLEDNESFPVDAAVTAITFGGHFHNTGPGAGGAGSCYGRYDISGAGYVTPITGVNLIGALPAQPIGAGVALDGSNLYDCVFSVRYQWVANTSDPATAHCDYNVVRVFYTGVLADTGTIVVIKVTDPSGLSQPFDFTTDGLTPNSFDLADGESQTFSNVPVTGGITGSAWAPGALATGSWVEGAWGGSSGEPVYGITEIPLAGYTTTYEVSNGSPHTNITVGVGETVTITVTNVAAGTPGSGIYKIVLNKRNDTLWTEDFATVDVKIPDPFIITGLVGS